MIPAGDPVEMLNAGGYSLVVENKGKILTFTGRGVADLYHLLLTDPAMLNGSRVADKIVGRGAAALMIEGRVASVHANLISEPALALFADSPVEVTFVSRVPGIINRRGNGPCPVEALCAECSTAAECIPLIAAFIENNNKIPSSK